MLVGYMLKIECLNPGVCHRSGGSYMDKPSHVGVLNVVPIHKPLYE